MKVRDILVKKGGEVVTVSEGTRIDDVVDLLHARRIGAVLVMRDDAVVGILSERDVVRGLAGQGQGLLARTAAQLMTREVRVCRPDDELSKVLNDMTTHRIRHLPVMEDGQLVGVVSIGDAVKHRLVELQAEANVLRDNYFATR